MTLKYTPISDIASRIGCSDVRSAEKRCIELGIKVHTIKRRKYIIEEDINREMELIYIENLKQRYPNIYKEIYHATKQDDYLQVYELLHPEIDDNKDNELAFRDYQAQSDIAKNFLKNLHL